MKVVNLARRPFVNERPVVRLAVALWVLGGALLALNVHSYSAYWVDSAEIRAELAQVRDSIDEEEQSIRALSADFSRVDLESLNERALFVNQLIRQRTFPWSRLFRDLEEVLPYELRLDSVQPVRERADRQPSARTPPPQRSSSSRRSRRSSRDEPQIVQAPPPPEPEAVQLNLHGLSKTDEAIYNLVDTLYRHPAFRDPNFSRENPNDQTGLIAFDIDVTYLTETEPEEEAAGEASVAGTPDTGTPAAGTPAAERTGSLAESTPKPPAAGEPVPSRNDVAEEQDEAATGSRPQVRRALPPTSEGTLQGTRPQGASSTPAASAPAAGAPAAGTAIVGAPVVRRPAAVPPAPHLRGVDSPRASGGRAAEPPAAQPGETAGQDAQEPRTEPRFVEPAASGTAPLGGASR